MSLLKPRHASVLFALATAGEATLKWTLALWVSFVINVGLFLFGFVFIIKTAPADSLSADLILVFWFLIGLPVGTLWLARAAVK